jgi:hypothetical protein
MAQAPDAIDDSYDALGNVSITVPALDGLLANDVGPPALSVTTFDVSSANGGTVSVSADGSFTYDPPPGFEGTDAFDYTIDDGVGNTDSATVFISVADVIWFIDNSAGGTNSGTFNDPFTSIAAFNSSSGASGVNPGDPIFIHTGSGPYGDGIILRNSNVLFGQGIDLLTELGSISIVPPKFSDLGSSPSPSIRPEITLTGAGNGITLAQSNTVSGLNVGNTPNGVGIVDDGGSVGTLTIDEVAISGAGGGIRIANGGTIAVSLDSLSATSSSNEGILLNNVTGSFGVTYGTIDTTNFAAVDISGTGSGVNLDATFESISSTDDSAPGISLDKTTGSFTVTGNGGTCKTSGVSCTGGTISGKSTDAILLQDVGDVSFSFMNLSNNGGHAIHAQNVDNIVLENSFIDQNAMHVQNEGTGTTTALINNNRVGEVDGSDGIVVSDDVMPGTLNATIRNNAVEQILNDRGLVVQTRAGGTACADIFGNTFTSIGGSSDMQVRASNSSTMNVVQADPSGSPPNLSTDNNNATVTVTEDGTPPGTINFSAISTCPVPAFAVGTIHITKATTPTGGTGFSFADDIAAPNSFMLNDGQTQTFNNVLSGTYTVTEADPSVTPGSFQLISISCDDANSIRNVVTRTATINLELGETLTCTFTNVTPQEATVDLAEEVEDLVNEGKLGQGQGNGLNSKLEAAIAKLNEGKTGAACNQLRAFINQVNDFITIGILTLAEGQPLIDAATNIRNAIC